MSSDTLITKVHGGMRLISADGVSIGTSGGFTSGTPKPVSRYAHTVSRMPCLRHLQSDKGSPTQAISFFLDIRSPKS
jgi:hypothetical protein